MNEDFVDAFAICIYCGDVMEHPNEKQIKVFGRPVCCEFNMLKIEREKIHQIVRSIDSLKKNLEEEVLKSIL